MFYFSDSSILFFSYKLFSMTLILLVFIMKILFKQFLFYFFIVQLSYQSVNLYVEVLNEML